MGILINIVFLLYFILNSLNYLNLISSNDEVFKNNINNLNPIKSMASKIMYYNIFQKSELDSKDISALKFSNLNNSQIISENFLMNKTFILKNTSIIKNLIRNTKGNFSINN